MNQLEFVIEIVSWAQAVHDLSSIREKVFIEEQHVPIELEWDELDTSCQHILASANGRAIGTGRLTPYGQIGRMAVLKEYRGKGVGSAILHKLIELARRNNLQKVVLNSQISAEFFYKKFGFETTSGVFDDAGIPHVKMAAIISH